MIISWKTDSSTGAVDTVRNWLEEGSNHTDYVTWADSNGRTDYKYEVAGDSITITEEWSITRAEYDALGIDHKANGEDLPMAETTDHLSLAE
jgi:hypothetical protein